MAQKLNDRVKLGLTILSILGIVLIVGTDYITGPDVLVPILYVGPIMLVAWVWGVRGAVIAAFACAVASLGTDLAYLSVSRHPIGLVLWNAAARGSMLVLIAALYGRQLRFGHEADAQARLFRSIVEKSHEAISITDADGRFLFVNAAHARLFGRSLAEANQFRHVDCLAPALPGTQGQQLALALANGESWAGVADAIDSAGRIFPMWLRADSLRSSTGARQYGFGFMHDVTEERRAQERLRTMLTEKETLLREVHHRVKNNMQVISSMLDLQREHAADPVLRESFLVAEERVKAMALLHEKLYRAADVANIDFADYLRALASESMAAHGVDPARIALRVTGCDIRLALDAAVPCALAVNELLTNAIKHAFPAGRRGEINIGLVRQAGRLTVTVRDNGTGLPDGFDLTTVKSLGLQLVNVLAQQLHGTFRLTDEGGVSVQFSFPSDEVTP